MFSDNMIIQRDAPIHIWGWTNPRARVSVEFASQHVGTVADVSGNWSATLAPREAGGPYVLIVKSRRDKIIMRNILVGEVWLCSGQSNMTFRLADARDGKEESRNAVSDSIRLYTVPRRASVAPERDCGGAWQKCTPAIAESFSAVAYYFGKQIFNTLHVPVGLIHASWPGTPAEAWTSWNCLAGEPLLAPIIARCNKQKAEYPEAMRKYYEALARFDADPSHRPSFQKDSGNKGFEKGFAGVGLPDSGWRVVSLPNFVEDIEGRPTDGAFWFRKRVSIPKSWLHSKLYLNLGAIDDFDIAYFNGVQVGATGIETPESYIVPRCYAVPKSLVTSTDVVIAVRAFDHFGGGGFAGPADAMELSCSSPNERLAIYGDWKYRVEQELDPNAIAGPGQPGAPWRPADTLSSQSPAALYNGMIAPIAPFAVRGVVWYQGEGNADRAVEYRTLLPAMISDWRKSWQNPAMPFGIVQLANFLAPDSLPRPSDWAMLREAQHRVSSADAHSGLAVIIDIGEAGDIHPKNKFDVGARMALWAKTKVYGMKNIEYSGPELKDATFNADSVRLSFDHRGAGLRVKGDTLRGFALAGSDSIFVWASARIEGDMVVVRSSRVPAPIALRYGWANNPPCNLYNSEWLPASPFRTDSWLK
jgi:sialate O-acetylesterase